MEHPPRTTSRRITNASITALSVLLLTTGLTHGKQQPPSATQPGTAKPKVHFLSPLKTLTFPDRSPSPSHRTKYFQKFKNGLISERQVRSQIASEEQRKREAEREGRFISNDETSVDDQDEYYQGTDWAEFTAGKEQRELEIKSNRIEEGFERGFGKEVLSNPDTIASPKDGNEYQFVGVILGADSSKEGNVKWYARNKPSKAEWTLRMVHVDKTALLRDLFVRGKVDIYGEYANKGMASPGISGGEGEEMEMIRKPVIEPQYTVKPRTWTNLWNFSPVHYFTDRSGMFWRERRIKPGMYTDGHDMFEASYRYAEGKNGMRPVKGDLKSYLEKYEQDVQDMIWDKVTSDKPDIVAEF